MTKVNASNGNETKSDIFPLNVFKFDNISFLLKYFINFQNQHFSVLTKV